jgi:hypothetical protein
MAVLSIPSDLHVSGRISCERLSIPAEAVDSDDFTSDTAKRLVTSKQVHQYHRTFDQPNTTATAETRVLHVVRGSTGTLKAFVAGSIVACVGAATITVDLRKNGSTVLTAVITLDSANTAYIVEAGTFASTSLVAGDVLTVVTTATAGGGTIGAGLFAELVVDEDPVV